MKRWSLLFFTFFVCVKVFCGETIFNELLEVTSRKTDKLKKSSIVLNARSDVEKRASEYNYAPEFNLFVDELVKNGFIKKKDKKKLKTNDPISYEEYIRKCFQVFNQKNNKRSLKEPSEGYIQLLTHLFKLKWSVVFVPSTDGIFSEKHFNNAITHNIFILGVPTNDEFEYDGFYTKCQQDFVHHDIGHIFQNLGFNIIDVENALFTGFISNITSQINLLWKKSILQLRKNKKEDGTAEILLFHMFHENSFLGSYNDYKRYHQAGTIELLNLYSEKGKLKFNEKNFKNALQGLRDYFKSRVYQFKEAFLNVLNHEKYKREVKVKGYQGLEESALHSSFSPGVYKKDGFKIRDDLVTLKVRKDDVDGWVKDGDNDFRKIGLKGFYNILMPMLNSLQASGVNIEIWKKDDVGLILNDKEIISAIDQEINKLMNLFD